MQWFLNLKISRKLILNSSLILALTAALGLFSIGQLTAVNDSTNEVVLNWMPSAIVTSAINTDTSDYRIAELQHVLSDDDKEMAMYDKQIVDMLAAIETKRTAYIKLISSPEEQKLYDTFGKSWSLYLIESKQLLELSRKKQNTEARALLRGASQKLYDTASSDLLKLVDLNVAGSKEAANIGAQAFTQARIWIFVGLGLTLVLGFAMATFVGRVVSVPLGIALQVARTVAAGDLTSKIEVKSSDETGLLMAALKDMNESLQKIVGIVRVGTDTIATASSQIASGNLDLSSRTEQQASSLEETASSMEELTGTVKQNADNARQATQLAESASAVAHKGGAVVSQVVRTMGSISDSSKKIIDIISVIDGIAFQTNILALNAAVEAARAGEQGRGFAVVASEVRNLAQRSASAAKEIKLLIGSSVEQVDIGGKLVEQAGTTMTEIVDSVRRVADIMVEIAAASQEQTSGIEQINQAISQMDEVTQQNAALVEEAAAAAGALQDQAQGLSQAVSVFQLESEPATTSNTKQRLTPVPGRQLVPAAANSNRPARAPAKRIANAAVPDVEWEEF
ncbi:MCP four helix bundle domain-containing protein [Oxalobacteraceae bacterium]|nr:MCP four helix bundle domain-containing protein [Oxalobacteraceae bacterium]